MKSSTGTSSRSSWTARSSRQGASGTRRPQWESSTRRLSGCSRGPTGLGPPPGRNLTPRLFVFTKFDRVGRDVLRAAKVGAKPPPVGRRSERAAYAEALLRHNLPRTLARIRERDGGRVIFARPSYFFAWLRTASTGAGAPEKVLLRRVGVGGGGA